jgi:uncharacterized membrane protein
MTTPYYGQPVQPVQPVKESLQQTTSKFWAGLFDFSFTRFITLRFIRVIYAVILGVILLLALVALVVSLVGGASNSSVGTILFGIFIVPIFTLLYIVFARLSLEFIAVVFRIGENTARIALASERGAFAEEGIFNLTHGANAEAVPPSAPRFDVQQ